MLLKPTYQRWYTRGAMEMYPRTTRRKNKDGSVVEDDQLAHHAWDSEKNRSNVQILHSFGRADQYARDALVRLCRSIGRVGGVEVRDLQGGGRGSR